MIMIPILISTTISFCFVAYRFGYESGRWHHLKKQYKKQIEKHTKELKE